MPEVVASPECDEVDYGPIPFGEEGAAFLRNILQHAVFLGFGMLILMILVSVHGR